MKENAVALHTGVNFFSSIRKVFQHEFLNKVAIFYTEALFRFLSYLSVVKNSIIFRFLVEKPWCLLKLQMFLQIKNTHMVNFNMYLLATTPLISIMHLKVFVVGVFNIIIIIIFFCSSLYENVLYCLNPHTRSFDYCPET